MRKKIKELMNREEGFTLVELLAVIVILGIIVAIAIPSISGVISRASGSAQDAEESLVIDAARLYFIENDGDTVTVDGAVVADKQEVSVTDLVDGGYLEQREAGDGDINGKVTRTKVTTGTGDAATEKYTYVFVSSS